jgi:hypothetical protein
VQVALALTLSLQPLFGLAQGFMRFVQGEDADQLAGLGRCAS